MATKKMYILRGNAAAAGTYPDEQGNKIAWPRGALHEKAATVYAQCLGYDALVIDEQGYPQSEDSPQATSALKAFHDDDPMEAGFYGFSGGGYNVRHILEHLAKTEPQSLYRIKDVVVLGAPNKKNPDHNDQNYTSDTLIKLAKQNVRQQKGGSSIDWGKISWTLKYKENPKPDQMPAGLPKNLETHMFGPDVLLSGWP